MSQPKLHITFSQAFQVLRPYVKKKFMEQFVAVIPIIAYLFIFQILVLSSPVQNALSISLGLLLVIFGLMFFMEGLRIGLMPLGETLGADLPKKRGIFVIFTFAFILGIGTTLAEPAIGALQSVGMSIDPKQAPLLYLILTKYVSTLALFVGIGVGIAVVLGILRFMYNFSLKWYIFPLISTLFVLTLWAYSIPEVAKIIGLAWDCGAVTTGPVTVPLVLALGLGVSRILSKSTDSGMSGFGIITLASILPIISVLSLGLFLYYSGIDLSDVQPVAAQLGESNAVVDASLGALQAILPLTLLLFLVQYIVVGGTVKNLKEIGLGIAFTVIGMAIFNMGLFSGLIPLGDQVGGFVPASFSQIEIGTPPDIFGPLYGSFWGKIIAVFFAFFLGYGATLAEPALSALGDQVENITVGAFKKKLLIQSVAFGVGLGIAAGITKMVFDLNFVYMLLIPYTLLLVITFFSKENITNIGWDAAGVTTGPITVPLVIALGLGVGNNIPTVIDGFGILSLASVFPILSVLTMGLLVKK